MGRPLVQYERHLSLTTTFKFLQLVITLERFGPFPSLGRGKNSGSVGDLRLLGMNVSLQSLKLFIFFWYHTYSAYKRYNVTSLWAFSTNPHNSHRKSWYIKKHMAKLNLFLPTCTLAGLCLWKVKVGGASHGKYQGSFSKP